MTARYVWCLLQLCGVLACMRPGAPVMAQGFDAPPRLLFSDLVSAPVSGGESGLGAYVTLWGTGLGAERADSTVRIGGVEVARYLVWGHDAAAARGLQRIVVQPGPAVTSGPVVVHVAGRASNPLPFAVHDGHIYFVAPQDAAADDTGPGTAERPFRSLWRPREVVRAGDVVVLRGGRHEALDPGSPGWDAILTLDESLAANGSASGPIAYVGHPLQRPVLGSASARRGILLYTSGAPRDHYVFSNLEFVSVEQPLPLTGTGHRVVGNHLHDGARSDSGAIGVNGEASAIRILGNRLERNGEPGEKLHHAIYLGGYGSSRDIEIGWNEVRRQQGGRAIQVFGHLSGDRIDRLAIHDNLIVGAELNGILLGGSDADSEVLGSAEVVNNIVASCGDPGLRINDPQASVTISHNTLYGNGSPGWGGAAQVYLQRAGSGRIRVTHNILASQQGQAAVLLENGLSGAVFSSGGLNLVHSAEGCAVAGLACRVGDPRFADPGAEDWRLLPGSVAIDAGDDVAGVPATDHAGLDRPQGPATDLGALEALAFDAAVFASQSDCLFQWAEQQYASLFQPAGAGSAQAGVYHYRYYPLTQAYLGTSVLDGHVYYLGPASAQAILDVGGLSSWLPAAGCTR